MKKMAVSLSIPLEMALRIEDMHSTRLNAGFTATTAKQFMAELLAMGIETWEERNSRGRVGGMDLKKLFEDFDNEVFHQKRKPLLKKPE